MRPKFWHILMIIVSVPVLFLSNAFAETINQQERDHIIDKRLNCFSSHAADQKVDWEDVCVNSKKSGNKNPFKDMDDKSLDQMVQEHQDLADEMLSTSVLSEENASVTVDDVYKKQNQDPDAKRSVDDVIKDQGIETGVASQSDNKLVNNYSRDSNGSAVDSNSKADSVSAVSDDAAPKYKKSSKKPLPDITDEPDLMSDHAKSVTEVKYKKNALTFDYERYYYEYTEDSVQVKTKGWWDGVIGTYVYRPSKGDLLYWDWINYYSLQGEYAWSKLDYSSGSTGTDGNQPNYMYDIRGLLGRDFYPVPQAVITPYAGFGFRYLLDDIGGTQTTTGQFGYDRKSHYFYLPFGLNYTYQANKDWRIVANGEYDIFLSGWQKSYLSDVPVPGYFDVRNDQKHGFGLRASVKFIRILPGINLSIEPFVRFWHIEDSEVANAGLIDGLEPENKTIEGGIKAGAEF